MNTERELADTHIRCCVTVFCQISIDSQFSTVIFVSHSDGNLTMCTFPPSSSNLAASPSASYALLSYPHVQFSPFQNSPRSQPPCPSSAPPRHSCRDSIPLLAHLHIHPLVANPIERDTPRNSVFRKPRQQAASH